MNTKVSISVIIIFLIVLLLCGCGTSNKWDSSYFFSEYYGMKTAQENNYEQIHQCLNNVCYEDEKLIGFVNKSLNVDFYKIYSCLKCAKVMHFDKITEQIRSNMISLKTIDMSAAPFLDLMYYIDICHELQIIPEKDPLVYLNQFYSEEDRLYYLESNGLELPSDYASHRYAAEEFVSTYVPLIVQGDINWTTASFGYYQSNVLLERIGIVLDNLNLLEAPSSTSRYTLLNSTVYGSWNNSYSNYNCYAYAIGQSGMPWPGYFSGNAFSITLSVSDMADNVLADLGSLGNWGYKVNTKPTVMPDSYFKLICIRKADNDFHFMKAPSSVNTWLHKPGLTWPLKWNYSSPNYCYWTNERVASDGIALEPYITYSSSVVYILYKANGAPGIQPPRNKK